MPNKTIVIDAGHGGSDPGAVDDINRDQDDEIYDDKIYSVESSLNYKVANELYYILLNKQYNAIMTRQSNKFISLKQRANIANNCNADIFVSVHHNASSNKSARGFEVLYYPTSKEGQELAQCVQTTIIEKLNLKDRGIKKRDNLYVLKNTKMPAILIEVGFISNPTEEKLLNQDGFQQLMTQYISVAIDNYFGGEC